MKRILVLLFTLSVSACQVESPTTPKSVGTKIEKGVFGPGTHLVGADIAAGRYFSNPVSGCSWERLANMRSIGGSIVSKFIGYDADQWIVDISPSDAAFGTGSKCGFWFSTPRRGFAATITSGVWLVGSQIQPGNYQTNASSGCSWERIRSFSGEPRDIIANGVVSSPGQQFVDIGPGDAGFKTDSLCGTWSLASSPGPKPD